MRTKYDIGQPVYCVCIDPSCKPQSTRKGFVFYIKIYSVDYISYGISKSQTSHDFLCETYEYTMGTTEAEAINNYNNHKRKDNK